MKSKATFERALRFSVACGPVFGSIFGTLVGCGSYEEAPSPPPSTESLAASIARENRSADRALNLLVRLDLSPDELFEVYEPAPGQIVVSGAGAPSHSHLSSADAEALSIEEIWGRVAGTRPMPETVHAALRRAALRNTQPRTVTPRADLNAFWGGGASRGPSQATPATADGAGEQLLEAGWCDTDYYSFNYGKCDRDWNVCLDNWWNGAWASHPDIENFYANVCAAQGSVTLKITSDEWDGGSWNVPQNTYRWYKALDTGCDEWAWNDCASARAEVLNATNDRFHFRFLVSEPSPCSACP